MYNSNYLNDLFYEIKKKHSDEREYIDAVEEFFDSMDYIVGDDERIEKNGILERLIEPERVISFRVPWVDDEGKVRVNTGYRVQFNSALGPYKGGIRFDKTVNLSILKFLGFEQTFKNSLTGLPMGGGKGGSDFDPQGKSDAEVMRFCQSFMNELYKYVGPNTDVPAGDLGCGAREIGYMFGQYKKLKDEWSGVFTGKAPCYGGSLVRPEATGYGLLYFVEEMLKTFKETDLKGKRVIISGCGKVGSFAAKKAKELGAIVVAMSDREGVVKNPNGIDVDEVVELAKKEGLFSKKYSSRHTMSFTSNVRSLWDTPCDIALPCATQGEIDINSANKLVENGCFMVVEGANMPTNLDAIRYFKEKEILFAPGKASNAGGVAVSGLEMTQNAMHLSWTFEEIDAKLKEIMSNIFKKCHETATKYGVPTDIAMGANIAGFEKVLEAMLAQGIC